MTADEFDQTLVQLSFEQALKELEKQVDALEHGQLGLEDALACFERGVKLLRRCYQLLERAEQRVQELVGLSERGEAVVRPFSLPEEEATPGRAANSASAAQSKPT